MEPFTASSCAGVFAAFQGKALNDCPFEFWTDKETTGTFRAAAPVSIKELLGGSRGSVLDVYGKADYEWDKWTVKLHTNRGRDTDVEIRYGKNLRNARKDVSNLTSYNAVAPFWQPNEGGETVILPEGIIAIPGLISTAELTTDYEEPMETDAGETIEVDYAARVVPVPMDLSSEFETAPTIPQLRARATELLEASEAWIPGENVSIDFAALWQTEEYKATAPLQRVALCDKVSVYYPELGINAVKKQVIKVVYDVLSDRYSTMELGVPKTSFAAALRADTEKAVLKQVPSKSYLDEAIDHATKLITGGLGGHVVFGYDADGKPNEILIMDTDDPDTAVNVWRFNAGGLGHSHSGYNGPFNDVALTQDGKINASMISTGTMSANRISGGVIEDLEHKNSWNLTTGEIHFQLSPSGEGGEVTREEYEAYKRQVAGNLSDTLSAAESYADGKVAGLATETFVNGQIDANNQGLRLEFDDVYVAKEDQIIGIQEWFYQSTSPTVLFGGDWVPDPPEWRQGMYIWRKTRPVLSDGFGEFDDPVCITGNDGQGQPGEDAKYLYITAAGATITSKDQPQTTTLTAHVGQGETEDIDPQGLLTYAWFLSADNRPEEYHGSGKVHTITLDGNLLTDTGSIRFAIIEAELLYLTDDAGNNLTDDAENILEVD